MNENESRTAQEWKRLMPACLQDVFWGLPGVRTVYDGPRRAVRLDRIFAYGFDDLRLLIILSSF